MSNFDSVGAKAYEAYVASSTGESPFTETVRDAAAAIAAIPASLRSSIETPVALTTVSNSMSASYDALTRWLAEESTELPDDAPKGLKDLRAGLVGLKQSLAAGVGA